MEFKRAMRIWARMCAAQDDDKGCDECPMHFLCSGGLRIYPTQAEDILAKWAAEHPERTIMDDFFAKHPKAPRRAEGYPYVCALQCGYIDRCPEHKFEPECDNCWRRPLEEVE